MSEQEVTGVLIIDDHPLLRKGIVQLLELEEGLAVVGEASSGQEGVEKAVALNPDIVLLDLNMSGMNGIETLQALRQCEIDARIIVFTVSDDENDVVDALRSGADGYLLKDMEPEDLLDRLRQAAEGQIVISDKLASIMAKALRGGSKTSDTVQQDLTERERQILKLITRGLSNKLIARKLEITEGTVKVHVKHLLKKLKLNSRVEAAVWGVKNDSN